MQKITPHLWFDTQAVEAADFYVSAFKKLDSNSRVKNTAQIKGTPSGEVDIVTFELAGFEFMSISAGPLFKFNPSISFLVTCETKEQVDSLWNELSPGGTPLMEVGEYPFSKKYGWIQDKYGLSWQIMYMGAEGESTFKPTKQKITPMIMFVGDQAGYAEDAINFYSSVFHDSKIEDMLRYGAGEAVDKEGTVKFARFALEGQEFAAMDSAYDHGFAFNEAVSLIVNCNNQEEIDYYWEKLSAVPESEQCGWLKDKFGLSWQIVPTTMNDIYKQEDQEKIDRVTKAFLQMKKFDIAKLKEAEEGK